MSISATFTQPGSLGLKLNDDKSGALVVRVNPGSQAEDHEQLCPGLVVRSVGETDVSGMEYSGVLSVLKSSKQRPITLTFEKLPPEPVRFSDFSAVQTTAAKPAARRDRRQAVTAATGVCVCARARVSCRVVSCACVCRACPSPIDCLKQH